MKATGLTTKIDEVGRIVIPRQIRKTLNLTPNIDTIEFFLDSDKLIIQKYKNTCTLCGSFDDLVEYRDSKVCKSCIKALSESAKK